MRQNPAGIQRITLDSGESFSLTEEAVRALRYAQTAYEAEDAFNTYATDIPRRVRCDVWLSIPLPKRW